ncbi:MAG TPA: tRNA (uridine(34)/cytosine(34)/5-carboxymethylaminomethyluridine(34)-2'-O)-methyltransferase TrmL [Burkholderiales bacterium]|nr:tRNA (uridine(34)/cytosine(34)/5-carboxymethylaminomethyluridine(34)-2'-O)-methyltransferase TrmL [Burkholderiales bacterium]
MFDVVLYQPEIPPNTGNVVRLCANTGCRLHLIGPLGFKLDDRRLRRAGLDYHEYAHIQTHRDWQEWLSQRGAGRQLAFTTEAHKSHDQVRYQAGDALVFGPETRGLPEHVLETFGVGERLRIPMRPDRRSLNLSNAVAVAVYEAWRQLGFMGGTG